MEEKNGFSEENYDEYEIDLREYIKLVWKHKWFITAFVVLAVLAAFIFSNIFIDQIYEAKSTLLILPSRYTTSLEVEIFSLDTYRNLANTDSIKQKIIESLGLKNEKDEKISINQLDNMMTLQILSAEESSDNANATLIVLRVKSKVPQTASDIANEWAKQFISDSKDIRSGEVKEIAEVIQRQFEDTEIKLNFLRENLLNFKKENRINIISKRLNNKENKLLETNKKVIDLESEIGAKKSEFNSVKQQISSLEKDGRWLGELNTTDENYSESYNLINVKENLLKTRVKLMEFNQNNNLKLLQEKINLKENIIYEYQNKIANLQAKLKETKEKNENVELLIESTPDKLYLNKSLDNNTLWNNILQTDEIDVLQKIKLTNETINPVSQNLKKDLSINQITISSLPQIISYYNNQIAVINYELKELRSEYYNLFVKKESLEMDLNNIKKIYNNQFTKYQNLLSRRLNLELDIEELENELIYCRQTENRITQNVTELQNNLWEAENKKEILEQKVSDVKSTYNALAKRVEEVRITEAQRTSDVKFYAQAVEPTSPISRNIKLNIAIAAVLAFMLAVFIVFFKEFMKEE